MKNFYVLIVVFICSAAQGFAQTYTWNGSAGDGLWNTAANWTITPGGGPGVPQGNTHDVVFNSGTTVNVTLSLSRTVRSIAVTGTGTVANLVGVDNNINLTFASGTPAPSFNVALNNTLSFDQIYAVMTASNMQGTVNGTFILKGTTNLNNGLIELPASAGTASININGTVIDEYGSGIVAGVDDYLHFNAGSKLIQQGPVPFVPLAQYAPTSEIIISGNPTSPLAFGTGLTSVGTLTYNSSTQTGTRYFQLPSLLFTITGDLNINNTNGQPLVLVDNFKVENDQTQFGFTVNGNFNISGNSNVILAESNGAAKIYKSTVLGNFNMSGNVFDLQSGAVINIGEPTTLSIKGNFIHTSGDITATSSKLATTRSLYNIEMSGAVAQEIASSTSHAFHNVNSQVALVISNPAGVTLTQALEVDMLGFTGGGRLISSASNFVKVTNTGSDDYIVGGNGFVEGPIYRVTGSTNEYKFPTGNGLTQRWVSVFPENGNPATFEASYSAVNNNTNLHSSLTATQNYYWEVNRIAGSTGAQVELTLPGAISGAGSGDAIVVAKSSGGGAWTPVAYPGSFVNGASAAAGMKIKSTVQSSFSSFTIAYGPLSATLPIELISFTASKSGSSAKLNWKISDNSTPASFEVLKSTDGANFTKLATVQAPAGKTVYDYVDNSLVAGNNYYRLKLVDKDGSVSHSNIITVMNGTSGVMITSMIPTMVNDRARLNISSSLSGNMQLVITDINGRIVHTQSASINKGNQEIWVNAMKLSSGYFQVTGYFNGEKIRTIRFFKR